MIRNLRALTIIVFILCFSFYMASYAQGGLKEVFLSLQEVTHLALENNFDIQLAKYDAYIKQNDLLSAESIFDTIISGKVAYKDDQSKPASTIAGTKALTNEYELNVEKKLPTGTTVETGLSQERSWTNSAFAAANPSHNIEAKVGLTQELGKNFFGLIDRGNIKITKLDIDNAVYTSLEKIENFLAQAQKAYWDLILKEEELRIEEEMLEKAEDLLILHAEKEELGLVEQPQILASGANLKQRESEVILAQNALKVSQNDLIYKLNLNPEEVVVRPKEGLIVNSDKPDYIASLKAAVQLRRDYLKEKNEAESRNIKLAVKENSLWPEINLELTFSRNGLEKEYKEAFGNIANQDNPQYYAGITFSFALENREARSGFNKAKLEKAKQILKLKSVERRIVVDVKDKVDTLLALLNAHKNTEDVARLQEDKLKAEERRFRSGRSDTDTLIRYQEDLLRARLALAKARYSVKVAQINLALAENSLLSEYWDNPVTNTNGA